jgi:hypothetical protein
MHTVFKAVRRTFGAPSFYQSAWINHYDYSVIYRIGERAVPRVKGSYLCVFATHADASAWQVSVQPHAIIFEATCRTLIVPQPSLLWFTSVHRITQHIRDVWRDYRKGKVDAWESRKDYTSVEHLPSGTLFTPSLTLIRPV